jgi:hypothetical protein
MAKEIRITLAYARLALWGGIALLAMCVQGCASTTEGVKLSENEESFAVPYSYKGFGAGPQPILGVVELNEGSEARIASRAVVEAMQSFQLSIVDPPAQLDTILPPNKPWKTDIAPVKVEDIAEYNRRFPHMALPVDRLYGIQYSGMYTIVEKEFRFRLESILFQRGAASDYRPYSRKDYSGSFFFERAKALFLERLGSISRQGMPQ